ncbi:hypothetical protein FRAHR75_680013 [Frankia sp. Hr75.2]|nr:hypothetical protein FRAHR75_680013 [Frankia sp. Hr75.2]
MERHQSPATRRLGRAKPSRAAYTERLELYTGILVLTQRNPVQLAKEAATVDVLSGGRLVLGVSATLPQSSGLLVSPWSGGEPGSASIWRQSGHCGR